MKAKDIENALKGYYEKSARYIVPNIYFFGYGYGETDLLIVREGKNKFIYDIEIKISKADFKADFKKVRKHNVIKDGFIVENYRKSVKMPNGKRKLVKKNTPIPIKERPNRFYYAVPTGLLTAVEVPPYAGLLYINSAGAVSKIKEAPLLHRAKVAHEPHLCRKFYFYWLNCLEKKR